MQSLPSLQVVLEQGSESLVRTPPTPKHKKQESSTSTEGSQSIESSDSHDQAGNAQETPSYLAQTSSSARKVQGSNSLKDDAGSKKKKNDTFESGVRKSVKNRNSVPSKHKKSSHSKTFLRAVSEGCESDDHTESTENSEGRMKNQKVRSAYQSSSCRIFFSGCLDLLGQILMPAVTRCLLKTPNPFLVKLIIFSFFTSKEHRSNLSAATSIALR